LRGLRHGIFAVLIAISRTDVRIAKIGGSLLRLRLDAFHETSMG